MKTTRRPNTAEARALRLIALHDGLLVTFVAGIPTYSTAAGVHVATHLAEQLIRNKWLIGDTDDAMFGARPQRYRCLRP